MILRLLHTKRLRREIARLEKMERDIALKTTQISEMVTPEPKPRSCWTPPSNSGRNRKTKNNPNERSIDKVLICGFGLIIVLIIKSNLIQNYSRISVTTVI